MRESFLAEPMLDIKTFLYKKFKRIIKGDIWTMFEVEEYDEDDNTWMNNAILQSFSCFTLWKTKRRLLLCDLQGILNTDLTPPMYQLTDPAIAGRIVKKESNRVGNERCCSLEQPFDCAISTTFFRYADPRHYSMCFARN